MRYVRGGLAAALAACGVALVGGPLLAAVDPTGEITAPSQVVAGQPVTVSAWVAGVCAPVLLVAPTSGESVKLAAGDGGAFCTDRVTLSGSWTALAPGEYTVVVSDRGAVVLSRPVTATGAATPPSPSPVAAPAGADPAPSPSATPAGSPSPSPAATPTPDRAKRTPSPTPSLAPSRRGVPGEVPGSAPSPSAVASPPASATPGGTPLPGRVAPARPVASGTPVPSPSRRVQAAPVPSPSELVAFVPASDAFPVAAAARVGGRVLAVLAVLVVVTWALRRVFARRGQHHG